MKKVKKLSVGTVFDQFLEFENVDVEDTTRFSNYERCGIEIRKKIIVDEMGNDIRDNPKEEVTFIASKAMLFMQILPE